MARPPVDPASPRTRTPLPLRKRLLFAVVPLFALLLVGELVARLVRAPLCFASFRQLRTDMVRRGYPVIVDPELGYVPRPGASGTGNHWGTVVTIDADGLRSNGPSPAPPGRPLVAVGDSFTFGDERDDGDSWPARLQTVLGRRVANGGVPGYSFAQTILRGEQLVVRLRPEWLLVSFIANDLERNEFSRRYFPVPWFRIDQGALVLQRPTAEAADSAFERTRAFKDAIGHSALADAVLATTAPHWWIYDQKEERSLPRPVGDEVGLLLVDRINAFCRAHDCRLLLLLQGEKSLPGADAVLAHARRLGVPTLDLVAEFQAAATADASVQSRWFAGHMTAAGNQWVAERIAVTIAGTIAASGR